MHNKPSKIRKQFAEGKNMECLKIEQKDGKANLILESK